MGGWVLKICLLLVRHQANDFCYPHRKYKNMGQIRKPKSFLTVQIPLKLMWGYILSQSQPEEIVLWVNSLLTCMNPVFCPPVAQNVCSTGAEPHPKSRTRLWDIFLRSGVEICIFYIGTLKTWILIRSGMSGWSRRTEQYLDLQAALSRWEHVCSWGQIQQQCSGHSYLPPGSVVNKGLEASRRSSAIAMELVQKNSSEVYEKNCSLFWSNCPSC